ncbi:choice-of-anchor I family protein [Metabacillus litoralis]|uniref:choice-of-anchor I family protein n=1 Tax=Metabacillus litoralis TaxID=152268 RepID=UPI001CFDA4BB|nr:choice-of-anchor I family protein [Metabacillus litoralis]
MMKKIVTKAIVTAVSCVILLTANESHAAGFLTKYDNETGKQLHVELVGQYKSGADIGYGGTEIVAYDSINKYAFSVNGAAKAVDILDLTKLKEGNPEIPLIKQITLSDLGVSASDVTSVAIHPKGEYIAIAAPAENKVDYGHVVFLTKDGNYLSHVEVGSLPDMLTFTSDGSKVLVANEGEPNDDYSINPEGTVSIIDVTGDIHQLENKHVSTIKFNDEVIDQNVRKVNHENTYAVELEPEYIVVDEENKFAYIALQENNAIAKLDLQKQQITSVKSLGYKDFSFDRNKMDVSNKDDEIAINNWPVLSMYQPDGLASYKVNGQTYILSANEGDAQDYGGFSEEARVKDLKDSYELNADLYNGYSQEELDKMVNEGLFEDNQLGRLMTTTSAPKNANDKYEAIYGYGARSFSIWNTETLEQTYDSGSDFEEITAKVYGENYFNSNNDENSFDSRSDDKGIEPESVIVGNVQGENYAFIGLERVGGIMIYNINNPSAPIFTKYFSSRVFNEEEEVTPSSGDVAPEGLTFIPAVNSPTGQNLLLAAHEVSGTIAAYQIGIEVNVPEENETPDNPDNPDNPDETEDPEKDKDPAPIANDENHPKDEVIIPEKTKDDKIKEDVVEEKMKNKIEDAGEDKADDSKQTVSSTNHKLPNTATSSFNFILLGFMLLIIGLLVSRRTKEQ